MENKDVVFTMSSRLFTKMAALVNESVKQDEPVNQFLIYQATINNMAEQMEILISMGTGNDKMSEYLDQANDVLKSIAVYTNAIKRELKKELIRA